MPKRIVICSDGTWNQPNQEYPTNVGKLARAVADVDSSSTKQVVFYDPGVSSEGGFLSRLRGGATGKGLEKNIRDAYGFLVENYEPGDEVFFFGFSRGAYTVRSTVGMIRNVGLLKRANIGKLSEAFALYRRRHKDSHPDAPASEKFRADHSQEVKVKVVGVWDTVGALGVPFHILRSFTARRYRFHDVRLGEIVVNAYQGLAIDERRVPFKPSLWKAISKPGQTVEQVWFVGVHTDVGGGNPNDGLVDVAFAWLTGKARASGLALKQGFLDTRIDPYALGPRHHSMSWWYRLLGSHVRPLGREESAAAEWVHRSADQRHRHHVFSYNPSNLDGYLRANSGRLTD